VEDKVASGQVFSKYFGFPCHFSIIITIQNYKRKIEVPLIGEGLVSHHLEEQRALKSAN
jgi:hypothetical protein